MKYFIFIIFASIGALTVTMLIAAAISAIISSRKKSDESVVNDVSSDVEKLTIDASMNKPIVDESLNDCEQFINFLSDAKNKSQNYTENVLVLDENIHKYKLTISFDIDSELKSMIDLQRICDTYNYSPELVNSYSSTQLLAIQTFALKFFKFLFPNLSKYEKGRNGICRFELKYSPDLSNCVLTVEYVYGKVINYNYPILDGYYFGCLVGSQIIIDNVKSAIDDVFKYLSVDKHLSRPVRDEIITRLESVMKNINAHKFPQFEE